MNTRDSALQMLDMRPWVPRDPQFRSGSSGFDAISPYLFRDIYIHLEAAIQEKQNIESQLSQQEAQSMPTLKAVLESNQKEAQEVLEGLFEQMRRLGLPPTGLDVFHRAFLKRVVGTHVPRSFPVRFYVFCCFVSRLVRAAKRRREKNVVEYTCRCRYTHFLIGSDADYLSSCSRYVVIATSMNKCAYGRDT